MRQGRVAVNGQIVKDLGRQIDPQADTVLVDDTLVQLDTQRVYVMLNKPAGYVTSCSHPGQAIVLDLVDLPQRIYPVGRLDKQSTGLLLMTSDGRLHHRLSHPSFDHEKEYIVTVSKPIASKDLRRMARGVYLDGRITRPAVVTRRNARSFRIVLQEGRNRQIRRMVAQVNNQVLQLHRVRMGSLRLGRLAAGHWRLLSKREREQLLSGAGIQ
jgi:23S rRNA pseudouridine2605 synthase/23S rRNA pseudouridine2604 synthase